jgi:hypothetical protein
MSKKSACFLLALFTIPYAQTLQSAVPSRIGRGCELELISYRRRSRLFDIAVKHFNESEIPQRKTPTNGIFALFILVHHDSIIESAFRDNHDFLAGGFFDEIFVFHEDPRTGRDVVQGIPIRYVDVRWLWSKYPAVVNPERDEPCEPKRTKWGYHHMIRFFWRSAFLLPEVCNVSVYMRIDSEVCLSNVRVSPKKLLTGDVVYVGTDLFLDSGPVCLGLEDFVRDYIWFFGIRIRNKEAWKIAFERDEVRAFSTNLEVMDLAFWSRREVQHFVHFVDCSGGIYWNRWGDAPLRYLAMAMFATPEMVRQRPSEWNYSHKCRWN